MAYHEATRDAGRAARVREALDVTGHALRMRMRPGLGSAGRRGRLLAAVAPFATVAVGASALWWAGSTVPAARAAWLPTEVALPFLLPAAAHFVMVLGAAVTLAGRWSAGTWTVLAGCAATTVADLVRGAGLEGVLLIRSPLFLDALVACSARRTSARSRASARRPGWVPWCCGRPC
ncbi:hypothetical protein [Streptomyces sp. C]|uniref:hypothetical protein n=1 Tax=Streptomyces sp. C TaxID=253839 RepID=UPI0001B54C3D|nr:hypothetical protein [Streptomyces sp. C]EFL13069.1 predicted protein [Streptomyces sp. C]